MGRNTVVMNLADLDEKRKPICNGNGLFNPTILNISKETLAKIKVNQNADTRKKVL